MKSVELELTYLAKSLPAGLTDCPSKLIVDVYVPASSEHPTLRLRQNGNRYEITKKDMADGTDSSHMIEHTISLSAEEFAALTAGEGKRVAKRRYDYTYQGRKAEFDVFEEDLTGLVVVDFEFEDREDQLRFAMPEFCLAEVTQEAFIAGGVLAGKAYGELEKDLARYSYRPLSIA